MARGDSLEYFIIRYPLAFDLLTSVCNIRLSVLMSIVRACGVGRPHVKGREGRWTWTSRSRCTTKRQTTTMLKEVTGIEDTMAVDDLRRLYEGESSNDEDDDVLMSDSTALLYDHDSNAVTDESRFAEGRQDGYTDLSNSDLSSDFDECHLAILRDLFCEKSSLLYHDILEIRETELNEEVISAFRDRYDTLFSQAKMIMDNVPLMVPEILNRLKVVETVLTQMDHAWEYRTERESGSGMLNEEH
ncbi:unnamed protein product [Soboliphyme baturini]|uniref:Uncharacterized protein n=1 Tax=Soboliphyme baturini TaxID=241478 RepID=A0A3P8BQX9_9BILA|nr:unnamed protein product [Soboliphyme baturini]